MLLALITVVAIGLGWWIHRAREQRRVVNAVAPRDAGFEYDGELGSNEFSRVLKEGKFWPPPWLVKALGIDYFHTVTGIHVRNPRVLREIDFQHLPHLQRLWVQRELLTDDELAPVARIRGLRLLDVNSPAWLPTDLPETTRLGDPTLQMVSQMPSLEYVSIEGYEFTAEGVLLLANSRSLKEVTLFGCNDDVDESLVTRITSTTQLKALKVYPGNLQAIAHQRIRMEQLSRPSPPGPASAQ
ncbi:MAG: hypothetical protein SFU86_19210 [Pirellulaceae bacterium]|nr:hypothetical protein [Pirellulaceae bacterium]